MNSWYCCFLDLDFIACNMMVWISTAFESCQSFSTSVSPHAPCSCLLYLALSISSLDKSIFPLQKLNWNCPSTSLKKSSEFLLKTCFHAQNCKQILSLAPMTRRTYSLTFILLPLHLHWLVIKGSAKTFGRFQFQ